ncbi:MAG: DUF6125 family protein [bacterium]
MSEINDAVKAKFFKRSYEAIDGLWFMKTEQESGFEHALEIDRRVWEVVPKIQARALRELLGIKGTGVKALANALRAKAELDGADVELELDGEESLRLSIRDCPWFRLMLKSKREHLAGRVGETICGIEYPVWSREFGVNGPFQLKSRICAGDECCFMQFRSE